MLPTEVSAFDLVNLPIQSKWIVLFGEREQAASTSQTNYWLGINNTGALYSRFGTVNASSQPTLTSGTTYNIKVDVPNRTLYVNNDSYTFTNSVISDITKSIFLGNINAPVGATLNLGGTASYRSMKITKNDNILHNFIPCYRKSDNEAGLYDIVTNTFSANAGTGAFAVGSDVADSVEIYADGTPETLTVVSETTQTASVENLFGVGDYKDEQEIISGAVTRACGIKVLDGTEEWTTDTYGGYRRMVLQEVLNASGDTLSVICSHYVSRSSDARQQPNSIFIASSGKLVIYVDSSQSITTTDEFNAWLAGQYANGTPVVIVYQLAETTTEQVTGQHLTAKDTATITANSDHISNIELEVEYWETAEE